MVLVDPKCVLFRTDGPVYGHVALSFALMAGRGGNDNTSPLENLFQFSTRWDLPG